MSSQSSFRGHTHRRHACGSGGRHGGARGYGRRGHHIVVLLSKVVVMVVVVGDRQPACVYDCSYTREGRGAHGHGLVVEVVVVGDRRVRFSYTR